MISSPVALPDEIWVSVLSFLPCSKDLRNAALVSPVFLRCATSASRQVIINEIDHRVLPDALAAIESSKIDAQNLSQVAHFSDIYLKQRPGLPPSISLADGTSLSELHQCVRQLAGEFQDVALRRLQKEQRCLAQDRGDWPSPTGPPGLPSAAETARYMRALYRFEIYCNLFKEPEVVRFNLDVVNFQRVHFFDTLSPWEIEQLVAARDFLAAAIIGPPLHALAELSKLQGLSGHQGASRSEPEMSDWTGPLLSVNLARENCHIKQNQARILCFGLRFLHKVWVTPVTQFDKVLLELPQQPRYASYNRVGEIYVWFCDAVNKSTELNNFDLPTENRLCRYTPAEYAEHVRKSAVDDDDDTGPEEAWYWAYNSFRGVENNDPRMINCRLFGMFFWDSARLHDVNFFTRVDFWWWRWEGGRQRDFEWETGPTQVQRFL